MVVCIVVGIGYCDIGKQVYIVQFMFFVKVDLNMGVIIIVIIVCRIGIIYDVCSGIGIIVCVMQVIYMFVQIVNFCYEVFIFGIYEIVSF